MSHRFLVVLLLVAWRGPALDAGEALRVGDAPARVRALLEAKDVGVFLREFPEHERWPLADDLDALGRTELAGRVAKGLAADQRAALQRVLDRKGRAARASRLTLWRALRHAEKREWVPCRSLLRSSAEPTDPLLRVRWLTLLGEAEVELGSLEAAATAYRLATVPAAALGWRAGEIRIWLAYQDCCDLLSDSVGLRDAAERLVALHSAAGNAFLADMYRGNLAAVLIQLGEPTRGFALFDEVLARLGRDPERAVEAAFVQTSLAMNLVRRGSFARALKLAAEAADVFRERPVRDYEVYAIAVEIAALAELGGEANDRRVLDLTQRIIDLGPTDPRDRADALTNRALALGRMERYDEAEAALSEAAAAYAVAGDQVSEALALVNRGDVVHAPQGNYPAAMRDYARARKLAGEEQETRAWIALAEGNVHCAQGAWPQALASMDAASSYAAQADLRDLQFFAEVGRARALRGLMRISEAQLAVERAYALLAEVTEGLGEEGFAAARGNSARARLYALGIRVAVAGGSADAQVAAIENARAAELLQSLGGRERLHAVALPGPLAHALGLQKAALVRARQALALAMARGLGKPSAPGKRERPGKSGKPGKRERPGKREYEAVKAEERALAAMAERVRSEAKLVADLTLPRPDAMDALQKALGPSKALLWYAFVDDGVFAAVLTAKGLRMRRIADAQAVEKLVERLDIGDRDAPVAEATEVRAELRRFLIDKLELPKAVTQLRLSPDGSLAHLPWAWLWRHRPDVELSLVPSGTTWRLLAGSGERRGTGIVALGDPVYLQEIAGHQVPVLGRTKPLGRLKGSGDEARAVKRPGDKLLVREDATKAALLEALAAEGRREAIHLACHGLLHPHTPGLSALALTPTPVDDGFLHAMDVLGIHVNTDLVVLSACSVGRGRLARGEGLMGLARAFMAAGAPRVIASLERIDDDATVLLMKTFYAALRQPGVGTAKALRMAQDAVRKVPKWKHPYYWANWSLWGLAD